MLLVPLAIVGCTKDNILTQTISTGDNTTPASTVDVPTDDEDDVDGTNFVRTISLVWSASSVAVTGDANNIVSVSNGTDVTINNTGTTEKVKYELSFYELPEYKTEYGEKVTYKISVLSEQAEKLVSRIVDVTSGKAEIKR